MALALVSRNRCVLMEYLIHRFHMRLREVAVDPLILVSQLLLKCYLGRLTSFLKYGFFALPARLAGFLLLEQSGEHSP